MEKKNIMMIVIIALLLILLGTIVGVSVFAYNFLRNNQSNAEAPYEIETVAKLNPEEVASIDLGEAIVGNLLKGSDSKEHVARFSVTVEIDNSETKDKKEIAAKAAFVELVQSKLYIVREASLSVIRAKTMQDMSRLDAQDILAEEILQRLQDEFNSNLIVNVRVYDLITS